MRKLTKAQREMLTNATGPLWRHDGYTLYGGRDFHTARRLEARGLGRIDPSGNFHITKAGRAALSKDTQP